MTDAIVSNPDSPAPAIKLFWLFSLLLLAAAMMAGLLALGVWQVQRLHWKLALIERVEQRVQAAPKPAPGPTEWSAVNREANEYSRVQVSGHFDHSRETLVRASTELGRGFWLLTPLQTKAGFWVLVNRGFVPEALELPGKPPIFRPDGLEPETITGLLRLSEPRGSWLQRNDAAAGRWYSRDVPAIFDHLKLAETTPTSAMTAAAATSIAPYFIDAVASAGAAAPTAWPRGGLTVLNFNNHHLAYALTWFVLAAMVAAAAAYLVYSERKLRAVANLRRQANGHA